MRKGKELLKFEKLIEKFKGQTCRNVRTQNLESTGEDI